MTERAALPLAMFPLGSPLLPHGVMQLRLFEPRYLALARDSTQGTNRFGIVLIERGHEVGGGDQRFGVGTIARIAESLELPDGQWVMAVIGEERITVRTWLPDDPYPLALVEERPDPPLDAADRHVLDEAEGAVRRALELQGQLVEGTPPADVAVADDPIERAWDLCALAPLGPFDRQRLLEADGIAVRLALLAQLAGEAAELLAYRLGRG